MSSKQKEVENFDTFLRGLWKENPVFAQLLGLCPVLAVSNSVANALAMGLATAFVLVMSSILVSVFRKLIPKEVRIAAFILIIATYVTIAEYLIQAVSLEIHKSLGAFIPLIVVNCTILGRQEAFASKNRLWPSIVDAAGTGIGFLIAIVCMGIIREILGAGTFLGRSVFGVKYEPWVIMILPGGGFFVLGMLLLVYVWVSEKLQKIPKNGGVS